MNSDNSDHKLIFINFFLVILFAICWSQQSEVNLFVSAKGSDLKSIGKPVSKEKVTMVVGLMLEHGLREFLKQLYYEKYY